MTTNRDRVSQWLAHVMFGPHYTAVVRMDYDDWHGRDSLTCEVTPFRARNRLAAACKALRTAQGTADGGWKSVHLEDVQNVR